MTIVVGSFFFRNVFCIALSNYLIYKGRVVVLALHVFSKPLTKFVQLTQGKRLGQGQEPRAYRHARTHDLLSRVAGYIVSTDTVEIVRDWGLMLQGVKSYFVHRGKVFKLIALLFLAMLD